MKNFVNRFSEIVLKTPNKIALVCNEIPMTYSELDILSSKIAGKLIRLGAKKNKIYPIVLDRSSEFIAAIIGTLKSGAAYSPLSLEYPKDRVDYIIRDAACEAVIDDEFMMDIENETLPKAFPEINMDDTAIVIYTSGSTGNPKGIIHTHYSFTHAIVNQIAVGCTAEDRQMSVTPFNFAISTHDILTSLYVGAEIHILTEAQRRDILFINDYIDKHKITTSVISPQLLKQLPNRKSSLRLINSGGERISRTYLDHTTILNAYGLSEVLSIVMSFKLDKAYDNTPIGKPINGYKVYILDDETSMRFRTARRASFVSQDRLQRDILIFLSLPRQYLRKIRIQPVKRTDVFSIQRISAKNCRTEMFSI